MITNSQSGTRIDEIADGIYRINTPVQIDALPGGFNFSQYLILDDEPLLFHTGLRRMFPLVREAVAAVMPVEKLRWAGYSHFEADECGAMNEFLAVAPQATPFASDIGTLVSLNDYADHAARGFADGEQFSIGRHRLQWFNTPHVPHGWDCGVLYDQTTRTLLCGDLFTQGGMNPPPVTESDILETSEQFRAPLDYFAHAPNMGPILERLAALQPQTLAVMHGSAFRGDAATLLRSLANRLSAPIAHSRASH